MAKKFTDLSALNTLSEQDIFAVVDDEGNKVSKQVNAEVISNYVYSSSVIGTTANTNSIINALSARGTSGQTFVDNGVFAGKVFFNNAYSNLGDVLKYSNLPDKPAIVTSNIQIENEMRFASLTNVLGQDKLIVQNIPTPAVEGEAQPIAQTIEVTLDHIKEGVTNKFFNTATVATQLEENFEALFNQYSASFDGGDVKDSVMDIPGVWNQQVSANVNKTANTMTVTGNDLLFDPSEPIVKKDDVLRVYGCSKVQTALSTQPSLSVAKSSTFETPDATDISNNNQVRFQYKVAKFNLKDGRIGPRTNTAGGQNTVAFKTSTSTNKADILSSFNLDKYIQLTIGVAAGEGALVYRRNLEEASEPFKLIAVLGPLDLANGTYNDYYNFDYTTWSGKNSVDGSFNAGTITYFPTSFPQDSTVELDATTFRGWEDLTVSKTEPVAIGSGYVITFTETVTINADSDTTMGNNAVFAHNDTKKIQDAIDQKVTIGTKSLNMNAKTYNVSNIKLPTDFGLIGVAGLSEVKKLPWSGYRSLIPTDFTQDASIIRADTGSNQNLSLLGLKFNGNIRNQYLLSEAVGNYIANFGTGSIGVTIDNCRFEEVAGAGVFLSSPTDLKFTNSEVSDSAVTDRYEIFAPLAIDGGTNTMVTGNVFKNFTFSIDASVTKEGSVIANNVIRNCGQGLTIFGSTFIVSSPNVLVGPSNEFLSSPDILNSEYDSVNILRSQIQQVSSNLGGEYISDPFVYQENGETFDLTQDATGVGNGSIVYRSRLIRGYNNAGGIIDTPTETPYGELIGPGIKDINGSNTVRYTNEGAKKIAEQSSNLVLGKEYSISEVGDVDWTKCGAPFNKVDVVFTYNGNPLQTFNSATGQRNVVYTHASATSAGLGTGERVPTSGSVTAKEFQGYRDGSTQYGPIVIENYVGNPNVIPKNGGFQLKIRNSDHNTLTNLIGENGVYTRGALTTLYNAKRLTSASDSDATKIHPFNTYHVGVAWTASYRYKVNAGALSSGGSWLTAGAYDANGIAANFADDNSSGTNVYDSGATDTPNAFRRYRDFKVNVSNLKHVEKGSLVAISGSHQGFAFGNLLYTAYGLVVRKTTVNDTTTGLTIRFFGTKYEDNDAANEVPTGQVAGDPAGTRGIINIQDDFVMAQGIIQ